MKRYAKLLILLAALGACAPITLVEPKRQTIADTFSVDPQIAWSKMSSANVDLWTVDGHNLEALRFYKGLRDGEALFDVKKESIKLPTFATGMTPNEVMEFVVDSLSRAGASTVEGRNLRPSDFGSSPGFRFELSFLDADGLETDGMVCGTVIEKRLYMILYTGARIHYFPKYRDEVERIIQSIETT